jgi:hypothetical protein
MVLSSLNHEGTLLCQVRVTRFARWANCVDGPHNAKPRTWVLAMKLANVIGKVFVSASEGLAAKNLAAIHAGEGTGCLSQTVTMPEMPNGNRRQPDRQRERQPNRQQWDGPIRSSMTAHRRHLKDGSREPSEYA